MSAAVVSDSFWESVPLGRGVEWVVRDASGIAALNKPAGVLSHPNQPSEAPRSLLQSSYLLDGECYEWTSEKGRRQRLWLLNRLDSATSGVVLVAADEALASSVRAQFKAKHIRKTYAALVFGVPAPAQQLWRDRLAVQKTGGQIRTRAGGNVPAEAGMKLVRPPAPRAHPPISLIHLEPRTGRSHQLRAQCAHRRLPIVGDATYGEFSLNRDFARRTGEKRLFLHSLETTFDFETAGGRRSFRAFAPLPAAFQIPWAK